MLFPVLTLSSLFLPACPSYSLTGSFKLILFSVCMWRRVCSSNWSSTELEGVITPVCITAECDVLFILRHRICLKICSFTGVCVSGKSRQHSRALLLKKDKKRKRRLCAKRKRASQYLFDNFSRVWSSESVCTQMGIFHRNCLAGSPYLAASLCISWIFFKAFRYCHVKDGFVFFKFQGTAVEQNPSSFRVSFKTYQCIQLASVCSFEDIV